MKSRFLSTPAVSSQLAISLKVNVDTLLYAATPLPQCKMCPEVGQTDILKYMTSVIKKQLFFVYFVHFGTLGHSNSNHDANHGDDDESAVTLI